MWVYFGLEQTGSYKDGSSVLPYNSEQLSLLFLLSTSCQANMPWKEH